MRVWVIAALIGAVSTRTVAGQRIDDGRAGVRPRRMDLEIRADSTGRVQSVFAPRRFSPTVRSYAPVASAVIPGAGQLMLGNDRFIAYAAVEVLGWWKYLKDSREQAAQEASYKELARRVGRSNFSTVLPDGDWTYYEAMRDWLESGAYSRSSTGPLQPETDTTTFNGHQWEIAQRTNPDMPSALAEYRRVAIQPDFRWSWRNAQLQYDIFKRTTFKRDDAYYASVQDLIVIGANHVLSMVDAFATIRLQVHASSNGERFVGAIWQW
jgi:hypothetical protein